MLAVVETHPVQDHAPVDRVLGNQFGIPVTAICGSDFSVVGYRDRKFGGTFSWAAELLNGYDAVFLSHSGSGGAKTPERVSVRGMGQALTAACCAPDLVEPAVTGAICDTGSVPSPTAVLLRALGMANRGDVRNACRASVTDYSVERGHHGGLRRHGTHRAARACWRMTSMAAVLDGLRDRTARALR